jgi:hypothetical protein
VVRYKKGVTKGASTVSRPASADATMEYRGPIVEVVPEGASEVAARRESGVRALSLAPVAVEAMRPSSAPPRRPPPRRSPDASLEFPHPVDPALFADASSELVPDFDDELPPPRPDRTRIRYVAFTGVMVLAGILFGLAIGSRSRASVASDGDTTTQSPPIAHKPPSLPAPTIATTTAPTAAPAPTTGSIVSPKWATGRRVYMDGGKDFGPAGNAEVPCGTHVVQIGTSGKPRKVNVPCGGNVTVLP